MEDEIRATVELTYRELWALQNALDQAWATNSIENEDTHWSAYDKIIKTRNEIEPPEND